MHENSLFSSFSEAQYRVQVEVEYFIALVNYLYTN
jgi:hypothetical protein